MPVPVGYPTTPTRYRRKARNYSTCLSFNGFNGFVDLGTANPFDGYSSFYFSFWINWYGINGNYQTIIAKRDSYAPDQMMFDLAITNNGSSIIFDTNNHFINFSYIPSPYRPTHIIMVHNSIESKEELWVNARKLTSPITFSTLGSKTDSLMSIGATQDAVTDVFNGNLDDLAIGLGTVSQEQAFDMYTSSRFPDNSLWAFYEFNEGFDTHVLDSSGNGHVGEIIGNAGYITNQLSTSRTLFSDRLVSPERNIV